MTITVDLGDVQPISGASFSTAFGRAGVTPPFAIYMLLSDEGKDFHLLGDLTAAGIPDPHGYKTHVYRTESFPGRARYVRFVVVPSSSYVFCDEIEIFAGTADQNDLPRGNAVTDIAQLIGNRKLSTIVQGRMLTDLSRLEALPGSSRRDDLRHAVVAMPTVTEVHWRRGLPYNDLHRRIWATHAARARKLAPEGSERLLVWTQNRWDDLHPFDLPTAEQLSDVTLQMNMIRGEHRSRVLNLTNTDDDSRQVNLVCRFEDGPATDIVTVREVIFVETQGRRIVANALPEARRNGDGWQVEVPAGATRQVWLTFHTKDVPDGRYAGTVAVSCPDLQVSRSVPVRLQVHPFAMPKVPTLTTTAWDYCHAGGYIRYDGVWQAAIGLMKEYFILAPWMAPATIPWPKRGKQVDEDGNIIGEIDWTRIDSWIQLWGEDAKMFAFYLGEPKTVPVSNFPLDSAAGTNVVRQFIGQLVERFEKQGIPADRIMILPRDEPHDHSKDESIVAWAGLLHEANPKIRVFTNPIWKDPTKATKALFEAADIVCPNLNHYPAKGAGGAFVDFYDKVRDAGKALWTYQCNGPVNELSAYGYFRCQAWHAFLHGMTGSGYWALADARHRPFGQIGSWNDFPLTGTTFSIIYWDKDGVTPSKQLEGIREGVQDYEYLVLLKRALAQASTEDATTAKTTLDRAVEQVCRTNSRAAADKARLDVLEALVGLQ